MKKIFSIIISVVILITLVAQGKLNIFTNTGNEIIYPVSSIDSITFNPENTVNIHKTDRSLLQYAISEIDSITFSEGPDTVFITYSGNSATVVNPLEGVGVEITKSDAHVVVNSTLTDNEVVYHVIGNSTNGSLKIYSEFKFNLALAGVTLTNTTGPAINIQSGKKAEVNIVTGTANSLTDGSTYSTSTEDQKATLFSEGQLVFEGGGSLIVKSNSKHAICSDDYIQINSGNITVSGAAKDGIHANDYFSMTDGTLYVAASGDGIDCEAGYVSISGGSITIMSTTADIKGIASESSMTISGGLITMTISGNQSKGFKSKQAMSLTGGIINVTTSGGVVLKVSGSGYDPSYCTAFKSDTDIQISGAEITVISTGIAGKGLSANGNITIESGKVQVTTSGNGATYTNTSGVKDTYNSTCITVDGNLNILGGTVITSSSGSGSKGLSVDGVTIIGDGVQDPTVNITTTGAKILVSGSGNNANYTESKAIKGDGAIAINNGNITISSADDGIKSNTSITINNGNIAITKAVEGIEAPLITVNDGNISMNCSDDAFNATKGNGGESNDGSYLYLKGGYIVLNTTAGDGLDSNGNIVMSGGTILVHGPQSQPEVPIDYNGTFNISGGLLVASGVNSNMTQSTSTTSGQYTVKATTSSTITANTIFRIQDASGNDIATFKPARNYSAVIISSPNLKTGTTYYIYTGGTYTGTVKDGLCTGGTYSGGTQKKSFTLSSKATTVSF
ncbi:carbohydrate-binding domain-containing protein [Paludibacter sp.]